MEKRVMHGVAVMRAYSYCELDVSRVHEVPKVLTKSLSLVYRKNFLKRPGARGGRDGDIPRVDWATKGRSSRRERTKSWTLLRRE